MPLITSGPSLRRLPLFLAYCPDRTVTGTLAKRLRVRGRHLERWKADLDSGRGEFGSGFKPRPSTPSLLTPDLPPQAPELAGSLMLLRAENYNAAWERIKSDVYWTEGVWDMERCVVEEFMGGGMYLDVEEGK